MKAILDADDPSLLERIIFTDETIHQLFENPIGGNVYMRCK
jgi:hypothetical protein